MTTRCAGLMQFAPHRTEHVAAQLGRRSSVEGQPEHTSKVSRLVSLVAVSLRRDRRLATAGAEMTLDESAGAAAASTWALVSLTIDGLR